MKEPRRWFRRWFVPLNAALVLIAVGVWWYTCLSPMARLKASGAPTTLAELIPEPIPDGENVAAGLRDLRDELGEPIDPLSIFHSELESAQIPPDQLEQAAALLQPHRDTVDALLQVINRPDYASVLTHDELNIRGLMATSGLPKQAARILTFATHVALAEGRVNDAAETTIATLRLGKLVEQEPSILRRLFAVAVQTIALRDAAILADLPDLSADEARRLDEALAAAEDRSSLVWTLNSERVLALSNLQGMPLPIRLLESGGILRVMEKALDQANTPLDELAAAGKMSTSNTGTLGSLLAPSTQSLFAAEARVGLEARDVRKSLRDTQAEAPE